MMKKLAEPTAINKKEKRPQGEPEENSRPNPRKIETAKVDDSQFFQKPDLSRSGEDSRLRPPADPRTSGKQSVRFEKIDIDNWDDEPPSRERTGLQQRNIHPTVYPHEEHHPSSSHLSSQKNKRLPQEEDFEYQPKNQSATGPRQRQQNDSSDNHCSQPNHDYEQPARNNYRPQDTRPNTQNWGRGQRAPDWIRSNQERDSRSSYRDSTIADIRRDKKQEVKSIYKLLSQTVQSRKLPIGPDNGPGSLSEEKMVVIEEEFQNRMRNFGLLEDHKESNVVEDHKNFGNYFQKKKANLKDNFRIFKAMHYEFNFPSHLQRKNNYRQYCEELPIYAKKGEFIRAIRKNRVIIFKSNPGSGKSTQLPQYLLDCISGRVLVTEPRVIAVEGVARRVIDVRAADSRKCRVWTPRSETTSLESLATSAVRTTTSTRRT